MPKTETPAKTPKKTVGPPPTFADFDIDSISAVAPPKSTNKATRDAMAAFELTITSLEPGRARVYWADAANSQRGIGIRLGRAFTRLKIGKSDGYQYYRAILAPDAEKPDEKRECVILKRAAVDASDAAE